MDRLGNPLRLRLTAGQHHNSKEDEALIDGLTFEHITADRSYAGL